MNKIYRNSLIMSVLTAIIMFLTIRWPGYFSYYLCSLIVLEFLFWFINHKVQVNSSEFKEKLKYLILPFLFNIGFIFFLVGIFSVILQYFFLILATVLNFYLFVSIRRVHNLQERASIFYRNIIVSSSFFTILLSLSALFRFYVGLSISPTFRVPLSLIVIATMAIFYVVTYFLAFENGVDIKKFKPYLFVMSLLAGELSLVSLVWIVNYPVLTSTERGNLSGLPLPAIFLTIIFYFVWGVFSHKIDKSLTRRVIIEYILFTLIFTFVLLVTAKWLPSI